MRLVFRTLDDEGALDRKGKIVAIEGAAPMKGSACRIGCSSR